VVGGGEGFFALLAAGSGAAVANCQLFAGRNVDCGLDAEFVALENAPSVWDAGVVE
jgi:hypothetical protein